MAVKGEDAVEEGCGKETCRGWIGKRPKAGEMGKIRHTLKRYGCKSWLAQWEVGRD